VVTPWDTDYIACEVTLCQEMVAVIPCVLIGPNCHPFRQLRSRDCHVTFRIVLVISIVPR
jgi:hypothetical protein